MFSSRHLMVALWMCSTYLSVCHGLPTEVLKQKRYSEGDDKVLYNTADMRHSASHSQSYLHPYTLHHRPHPRQVHGHRNTTHSRPFKWHPSNKHEIKQVDVDGSAILLAAQVSNDQVDENGVDNTNKEKRREIRKKEKSEGRRGGRRKNHENIHYDSDVDDVLAALVGYSRDPSLWRFVHSVVAELDYSKRVSNSSLTSISRHHHTSSPLSSAWTRGGKPQVDKKNKNGKQGLHRNPSTKIDNGLVNGDDGGDGGGIQDDNGSDGNHPTTINSDRNSNHQNLISKPKPTSSRYSVQHSQLQYQEASRKPFEAASLDEAPARMTSATKMGLRPTHPPHFIFHKVYIDTNYDPHTGQPYHRPVLAVKVVSGDKTKALTSHKGHEDGFPDTMDTMTYQMPEDSDGELPDKLEELLLQQNRIASEEEDEEEQEEQEQKQEEEQKEDQKEEQEEEIQDDSRDVDAGSVYEMDSESDDALKEDLQRDWSEKEDLALEESLDYQGWHEITQRRRRHRHFLHHLRQLHSFESQIRYLRRWQERLWRKRNQWANYFQPSLT